MNDKAAMRGSYADLKTIKTRSSVQMIVEFPIEAGAEIVRKFGFPQPGEEIPVAIARLAPDESLVSRQSASAQGGDKPKSMARAAKMLAKDKRFREWIAIPYPDTAITGISFAEAYIEAHCGVESCAEILEGTEAGKKFKQLQAEFLNWRDAQEYAG